MRRPRDRVVVTPLAGLARGLWRGAADALLAQSCALCGADCGADPACAACVADLPVMPPACPRCALPSAGAQACGACLRRPPAFDASHAAWHYDFPVDRLVGAFKYQARLPLARLFARGLACLPAVRQGPPPDLLLPMPLHASRLASRGYNQAMELARELSRLTGWRVDPHLAARTRATTAQTTLRFDARAANVRGAFRCERRLDGMHVAVLDDVMTTGATLGELARTLKAAGAASVSNWVIARAYAP